MPITNNNKALIDLPMWEALQPLASGSSVNGTCFINDLRGTDRYIYVLQSATTFWRYDTWSNTYQQLANPASGNFGNGTCMTYDPNQGASGSIWLLLTSGTGTPAFHQYDIATNAWTSKSVTNLPSTFGTDGELCHTCTSYHASGNNDHIYLIGNNSSNIWRYSISGNSWTQLAAPTGAVTFGSGCGLEWLPTVDPNLLYAHRGSTTTVQVFYNISGNSISTISVTPNSEAFSTGSYFCPRAANTSKLWAQNQAGRVYQYDFSTYPGTAVKLEPLVTNYLLAQGAQVVGNRMCYVRSTDGIEWLYTGVNTSSAIFRSPLIF